MIIDGDTAQSPDAVVDVSLHVEHLLLRSNFKARAQCLCAIDVWGGDPHWAPPL